MVPHLQQNFLDVDYSELAGIMFTQRMKLLRGDGVGFDCVIASSEEGAHVLDKTASSGRQQFQLFLDMPDYKHSNLMAIPGLIDWGGVLHAAYDGWS